MPWRKPHSTFIWIFPVGRGNCAFVRTRLSHGFILDMAAGDDGFNITKFIKEQFLPDLNSYPRDSSKYIAQTILSHPHTDHIAKCADLKDGQPLSPSLLTCPNDKQQDEAINWGRVDNKPGSDNIVKEYKALYTGRTPPLQTIKYEGTIKADGLEYGIYYIKPPVVERIHPSDNNHYTNSTSLIFWLRHGSDTILFPCDMMPEGMEHVLKNKQGTEKRFTSFFDTPGQDRQNWNLTTAAQPTLPSLLKQYGLSVLVAPHHGLESCYSPELYRIIRGGKPGIVCISEHYKPHEKAGDTDARYQKEGGSIGMKVLYDRKAEFRNSVTTKAGHHILVIFNGNGSPEVMADTNPFNLIPFIKK